MCDYQLNTEAYQVLDINKMDDTTRYNKDDRFVGDIGIKPWPGLVIPSNLS